MDAQRCTRSRWRAPGIARNWVNTRSLCSQPRARRPAPRLFLPNLPFVIVYLHADTLSGCAGAGMPCRTASALSWRGTIKCQDAPSSMALPTWLSSRTPRDTDSLVVATWPSSGIKDVFEDLKVSGSAVRGQTYRYGP
ncbi:hypothetical protein EVAR_17758_1 [Eumeta japonica]|uniref:Uncharacterized protein n=1 Tax=Eumeta variegata TaxID=151549 RepID=A0A4C1TTY7_EUMVA|nr:hypothetical protein EVAR_17758_1 [Eumeta japonica]